MTTPKTKRCPKGTRKNKDGQCVPVKTGNPVTKKVEKKKPAEKKPAEKKSKKENKKKSPKRKTVKKTTKKASPPVAIPVAKMNTPPTKPPRPSTVEELMHQFKVNGITFLESLSQNQLNSMIHVANEQFHSHTSNKKAPTLTDGEFDIVKEYLEKRFPKASALQEVGAPVTKITAKQKVNLPVSMPSMDKIKPDTNALSQWKQKYTGPYVLSCKLDGVSGLYYSLENSRKLYTRGDGAVGQDITGLLSKLSTIPKVPDVIVRGEFILSKSLFERKYKSKFANIRNMVAGLVNRKTFSDISKDIDFVAYEVIHPVLKPSEQMSFLQSNGFNTVQNVNHTTLTNDFLSETLMKWRTEYEYEIDGVIVTDDKVHKRINKNPEHAFAFKMVISDQVAETHVLDVIWTASKDGYLKPRVRIDPVRIGGVTIEYATGFNGQFIESNKIGVGAVIQLVRSGDVIPYIKSVTTPASIAKMPSVPYSWNSTHVDVLLTNKDDDPVVLEKQITAFFTTLEVVGLSTGNVRRLIQSGYNNVPKIVHMTLGDFQKVEGFQEKLSQKVHTSIHEKIRSSSLARLLAACGCLGRGLGERKLKPILESYPTIFTSTETPSEKLRMLMGINGIGKENAKSFIEHMAKCTTFLNACGLGDRLSTVDNGSSSTSSSEKESNSKMPKQKQNQNQNSEHPLFNKKIVFTGFREKELMKKMEDGYKVSFGSSVSKNIFMLVVKELTTKNAKVEQARKLEIPIMNFRDFREKYFGSSSS